MNASGFFLIFLIRLDITAQNMWNGAFLNYCVCDMAIKPFSIPLRNLLALAVAAGDDIYPEAPWDDVGIGIPGPNDDILDDSESLLALHPVAVGNLERWFWSSILRDILRLPFWWKNDDDIKAPVVPNAGADM